MQIHRKSPTSRTTSQGAPFKRRALNTAVLAIFGSASLLHPAVSQTATPTDPALEALQKENAALRAQLEALKAATAASAPAAASASASAPAAAASAPASAPDATPAQAPGLSVTVRSRKPLQTVKEIPQSISVVSGDDLKQEDSTSLEAITKRLSNVKWNYGNSQTSNYSIRGLGKIANSQAADPSVGLYVDGVAFAYNPLASFEFYDVDTAAVSRGPQGFAYGKNATIGAIQLRYKRPSFVPSTEVSLGYNLYEKQTWGESNGNVTATAVATGPIEDGLLAYRTSLRVNKGGGWIYNSYNPDNQYINSDRVSGRLQLLATPSADFDARIALEVNPRMSENANIGSTNFFFKQTPATYWNGASTSTLLTTEARLSRPWFTRNASYTVTGNYYSDEFIASDTQQGLVTGSNGLWAELNWTLNDSNKLTSVTAFKDYYFNAFRDDEGTVFDVQTAAGQNIKHTQYSQELRLKSKLSESVDLTTGLFALRSVNDSGSNAVFGSDAGAWFASNAQYGRLDADSAGRQLLVDSLADLWRKSPQRAINKTLAFYSSSDWKLSDDLSLNTGARFSHESRRLQQESKIIQQGYGVDLNPGNIGGFNTTATGALGTNTADQIAVANRVALRYFGVANYASLTPDQQRQVADAKAIRAGRIGTLHPLFEADRASKNQITWSVSPSLKLSTDSTAYLTLAHGEKSGVPGILTTSGSPVQYEVRPEKNNAAELGVKNTLFGGQLVLNAAAFINDIKDYQQTVSFYDAAATAANGQTTYTSAPGNVPKVRAKGLELDAAYTGFQNFELRFSGAYNDARYRSYPTAALPVERANEASGATPIYYYDASGKTLPGASKLSLNLGVSFRKNISETQQFHASWNTSYNGRYNSDNNLSEYAWIPASSVTDVSLGVGAVGGRWDFNFYVKNLFDDDTPRNVTWNAWAPTFPRLFGITLSTKL
ncbi:TonB-dependent receptor [Piscinibacter sp. HJYY11]|uniref:TonB-dependent receptor n=1 Tax=Piscinibacter sp. HJYY11 TaxID=2801333 RepID=UPI00191F83AD|nr:TonB-dependent receptor [Piscinibacter sp. HJYY11]MBL0728570.1 TonB-dependent receptor [Piscinibacter sp. HJYY11]